MMTFLSIAYVRTRLTLTKWIVIPLIWRGSNFYFFAALYGARLVLQPCLQARGTRDWNKGSKSSRKNKVLLRIKNYCPDTYYSFSREIFNFSKKNNFLKNLVFYNFDFYVILGHFSSARSILIMLTRIQ